MPYYSFLIVLLSAVILLISLLKTDFAIIILIFSMLLSPELSAGGGITGRDIVLRIDDIFLFMVFLGWLAKMAINKELGLLRSTLMNRPILFYIAACLFSTGIGTVTGTTNPKEGVFYILKYIEYFMLFFMVSNNIRDKKQVKTFIFFMLLTCFIVSIYGIYSYRALGLRATAPFEGEAGEANTFAGYLILMIGISLGLFIYLRSLKLRLILGGLIVIASIAFLFTLSRGGWFGFIPMYMAFLILSKRNKGMLLLFLIFALAAAPVLLPKKVVGRFHATFSKIETYTVFGKKISVDGSTAARIHSWKGSLKAWSRSPVIGYGVPGKGGVVSDVQYTRILREVGIIGFLIFVWMISRLFKAARKSFNDIQVDDFGKGLSLGFICGLAGLLFVGVAAEVFIIIRIMEPFWFLAAIVVMLPKISASPETV